MATEELDEYTDHYGEYIDTTLVQDSGYTEKRIPEKLREKADYIFIQRKLGSERIDAKIAFGIGEDGVVDVTVDDSGSDGNNWNLEVEVADSADSSLSADVDEEDEVVTVTLGTDSDGDPDDSKNTAELVADEIDDLDGISADYSGDGSGVIDDGDVAIYKFRGGMDAVEDFWFTKDYQIVKTPNDDIYHHVGDIHKWIADNDNTGDILGDEKLNILSISANGKWMRNF